MDYQLLGWLTSQQTIWLATLLPGLLGAGEKQKVATVTVTGNAGGGETLFLNTRKLVPLSSTPTTILD